jgi:molybdenum cofactor cytidylyltransferase
MKFARIPVDDATGAILAHSVSVPGGSIKKGRVLIAAELARLKAAGLTHIIAAQLEAGDIGEDNAAGRIARAASGENTHSSAPFTGRANLYADTVGLAEIDGARVHALNMIDEGLTIATTAPFERVSQKQMVATIKIITFALPEAVVARAEALARTPAGLIRIAPLRAKTAGLILTRLPATKPNVLAKREQAIAGRLENLGSRLGPVEIVDHEQRAVTAAITRMTAAGAEPIIVFAASAIVDRGDVIPAGLVAAGGEILRLGMPVDPGNLMLLGRLGGTDVIGAPSCAASPKLNGFDWVLERRLAGLDVGSADVAAMGLGGLLKEIATRPQPRELMAGDENGARSAPRIAALILAAGRSTRYGGSNKLLADLDGVPIVRRVALAALESRARPVVVVTGHQADRIAEALEGLDVQFVHNPNYAKGLSTSLKTGIGALAADADGAAVCLGDMPRIEANHIDRLISAFAPKEGRLIALPLYEGKRGNPVLFGRSLFAEMMEAEGDTGARHIIGSHADEVVEVDLGTDAIFADVDTPEALQQLQRGT